MRLYLDAATKRHMLLGAFAAAIWTFAVAIPAFAHGDHDARPLARDLGQNLFGSPVPTSILQQFIPRPELRLLYNLAVFIPMVVAMWLHTRRDQADVNECTCADAPMRVRQAGLTGA